MSKRKATVSNELYASVYSFLNESGHASVAKALLKDAKLSAENLKSTISLDEAFNSFTATKRPIVAQGGSTAKKAKVEDSSSSSSDSSSDSASEEDVAPVKAAIKAPPAKAIPAKKQESSSSSSDSSEDEKPAAKPVSAVKPAPAKATPASKKVPAPASSSDSSSSESDSSDDEAPAAKPIPVVTKVTPVSAKKAKSSSSSSSSDSSDSDSEVEAPSKLVVKAVPAKTSASKAAAKKESSSESSSSSSSDSDESSEDEKPVAKKNPAEKSKAVAVPTPKSEESATGFKAYVRGLPWAATEKEIRDFFKACGKISVCELPLGDDGRASGTAFVTFPSKSEYNKAIELDGQYWPGTERWLSIKEASDKPEAKKFEVGVRPEGCNTVFVGNLPWDVTEEVMRETFSAAGEVANVRFAMNEDGSLKGFGHVEFCNGDDTVNAVGLAGSMINGRACRVDYAPPRAASPRDGGGRGGGRGRGGDSPRSGRDGGRGRGGRGAGGPPSFANKNKGTIAFGGNSSAKKMTFDE